MSEEKIKQPENWQIAYREFKERQSIDDKFEVNSLCFIYGFQMGFKEKPPVNPSPQSGVEDAAKKLVTINHDLYNFLTGTEKPFKLCDISVMINELLKEEITMSRFTEKLNETAFHYTQQVKPAMPWISVKDSLPKDHTYVIGYYWNGRDIYEFKHGCFFIGLEQNKEVTHWMTLPEPPIQ